MLKETKGFVPRIYMCKKCGSTNVRFEKVKDEDLEDKAADEELDDFPIPGIHMIKPSKDFKKLLNERRMICRKCGHRELIRDMPGQYY